MKAWFTTKVTRRLTALASTLLLGALALPPVASASTPPVSGYAPAGYSLQFYDTFDGPSLNTNVWDYRTGYRDAPYNTDQLASNVSISNGKLVIHGTPADASHPHNTGGGVISKATFKYGYYETYAKLQSAAYYHSAFWTTKNVPGTKEETEIDGFEHETGTQAYNIIRQNVIQHDPFSELPGSKSLPLTINPETAYHYYGMKWEPDKVTFYVDGQQTNQILYSNGQYSEDYNSIWLSMIGLNGATTTADCYFDYVEYYAPPQASYPGAIVIDNSDPGYSQTGTWSSSQGIVGYKGTDYVVAGTDSTPAARAKFTPTIATAGNYDVYVWYEALSTQKAAPIEIRYNGGANVDTSKSINEAVNGTCWYYVGTYPFAAGSGNRLDIIDPTTGNAVADSAMFVPSDIVIDNSDSSSFSTVGTWSSSSIPGHDGSGTIYSNSNSPLAKAIWTPHLNGKFEAYIYKIAYSNGDPSAAVQVVSDSGTSNSTENWQSGTSGWVDLGAFTFSDGTTDQISLTYSGTSGYARADAVKLVRIP